MLKNYFEKEEAYATANASTILNAAEQAIDYLTKLSNEEGLEAVDQAIQTRKKEINEELNGNVYNFESDVLRYAKAFAYDLSIIFALTNPACKGLDAFLQSNSKAKKEGETR